MRKPHVLLMDKVHPTLIERLAQVYELHTITPDQKAESLGKVAQNIQAIVANGETRVTAEFLAKFPVAKILAVWGVGYDGVDVTAAHALGISVVHTPGVLTDDVADLAMGLILATARAIPAADNFVRNGQWMFGSFPLSRRVSGTRLGIVGLGRIGMAIAQRALAFKMKIAYSAREKKPEITYPYYQTPQALAAAVDYLVVCTTGGNQTRGLINMDVLNSLGPEGILINVSRGSVIDEQALISALIDKKIAGAGLDVFIGEPKVADELIRMNNVVLTPHIASATLQTRIAMSDLIMQNLAAHFQDKPLATPVPTCP
jgi:hydroxypyruvate reductase